MAEITEEKKEETPQQASAPSVPSAATDDKTMLSLTHASGIILGFIVPLIMFLVKTDASEGFKASVKEALNFQITMLIASIALSALTFGFGGMLVWAVNLVLCIVAAMKISNGEDYRYPFAIRLVK